MVVLGGGAVSYERGTPIAASQRQCSGQAARPLLLILPPAPHPSPSDQILYVKKIKSKLSGNEIDHSIHLRADVVGILKGGGVGALLDTHDTAAVHIFTDYM